MNIIPVAGTHGARRSDEWHHPQSPFFTFLRDYDIHPITDDPARCYGWDTDLDGVVGEHYSWRYAGLSLAHYIVPPLLPQLINQARGMGLVIPAEWQGAQAIPAKDTIIVSHSHGLQPVLYACGEYGLKVDTLIDVSGPVRHDLMDVATKAKVNIRRWVHFHGGRRDLWQWFGAFFDGHKGIVKAHPLADENVAVPPADHGDLLRTPAYFPLMLAYLLGQTSAV